MGIGFRIDSIDAAGIRRDGRISTRRKGDWDSRQAEKQLVYGPRPSRCMWENVILPWVGEPKHEARLGSCAQGTIFSATETAQHRSQMKVDFCIFPDQPQQHATLTQVGREPGNDGIASMPRMEVVWTFTLRREMKGPGLASVISRIQG